MSNSNAPERSLNRQVVLEEDEYTAALSKIIARDFFPSLEHLDATNGYLDAVNSGDHHLIQASARRLEVLHDTPLVSMSRQHIPQTPSRTPWSILPSDTPLHSQGDPPLKRPKYDSDLNLDAFQARYTSEDNSSFTHILDEENRVRKEKYCWAWEAQKRVEAQQDRVMEARERMLIEPPPIAGVKEKFMIEAPKHAALLIAADEPNEQEEKGEDDEEMEPNIERTQREEDTEDKRIVASTRKIEGDDKDVDVMAPKKDTRSAGVDGWKFKTRNSLMFSPDADTSPYESFIIQSESKPNVIKYNNTRLPEQDNSTSTSWSISTPPSPTRSRVEAAITGAPYRPRSPKEIGFSLVPNLPSPTPAELGPTAMKQLMTWGTLNATPRIIAQSDDPADAVNSDSPFHLPEMSSREAISHRLSNNASKSLRAKAGLLGYLGRTPGILATRTPRTPAGKKGGMAPPSWTPKRADGPGNLTPAARRLLEKSTLGTAGARRAQVMERNAAWERSSKGKGRELDRARWTSTPGSLSMYTVSQR